tara:strand:+ start:233 stop:799 length:567 start_codon:yes stop_codon:yes gene_type:complete
METCRYIFIITCFFYLINSSPILADFKKLENVNITAMDFLLTKFDNFFIKSQYKILRSNPLTVAYESINYNVIYEKDKNIQITLEAVMDKRRYERKKYFPKLVDCNIIRNKIFYNKLGYSGFLRKKNYSLSEVDMRETLKRIIYNLENFDEATKDFLIEKTIIKVEVIHPRKVRSISCSGNIADIELR